MTKLEVIRKCVNAYDPEQLLKIGCPTDEYDREIKDIAEEITKNSTIMEVWIIICNTFHWYFHSHSDPVLYWNAYKELAEKIVTELAEIEK